MSPLLVIAVATAYMLLLFALAFYGDRRAAQGRSLVGSAWVYALSLAVYCTAWTYFGSIGRAATDGLWFLPIYLGPTLAMILGWVVVRKMIRIAKTYRISSIADFISSRYGKSPGLAAVVTLIMVVGIVPYIALQLKGISIAYGVLFELAHTMTGSHDFVQAVVARWLMAWGDAFITGMLVAVFVAFAPQWLATWSDARYLHPPSNNKP